MKYLRRLVKAACIRMLLLLGLLIAVSTGMTQAADKPITGTDVNFDALFLQLQQLNSPEIKNAYRIYLGQHVDREFQKFLRDEYSQTREGLLQAFNEMLADPNLCEKVSCGNPGLDNRTILEQVFPGVLAVLTPSPGNAVVTPEPDLPPPAEQGSIVFLDTSGSMKGYFSDNARNPTNFQKFLLTEFRNILSSEGELVPLNVCRFGMELSSPKAVRTFDFYKGDFPESNTDIINVFRSDEFYQYSLSIIITDGIQSDPRGGFDSGGLLRAVQEKLEEGFQVYLIGIRAEFNGYVYPEIPPKGKFSYQGLRPMYIWFAARDKALGDRIASEMFDKLQNFVLFDIDVGLVKLGKRLVPDKPDIQAITIVKETSPYYIATWNERASRYDILVRKPGREEHPINIPISYAAGQFDENLWDIQLQLSGSSDWITLSPDGETWVISFLYNSMPQEKDNSITLRMAGQFRLEEDEWWLEWSTNDDTLPENADKSLYLETLVTNLIEYPKNNEFELATLELSITKR